jgi:hypothetical protein
MLHAKSKGQHMIRLIIRLLVSLFSSQRGTHIAKNAASRTEEKLRYEWWRRQWAGKPPVSISLFKEATRQLTDGVSEHQIQINLIREGVEPDVAFDVVKMAVRKLADDRSD